MWSPLRFALLASAAPLFLACASARQQPEARPVAPEAPPAATVTPVAEPPPQALSGIRFSVDPPDAQVFVDGRSVGQASALAGAGTVRLSPGLYRVSVEKVGFQTWRAEVAVRVGVEPIEVKLLALQR
jgi:hypothetical protein